MSARSSARRRRRSRSCSNIETEEAMRFLFGPGIALMHRLAHWLKLPLLGLLFMLPLGILYYDAYAQLSVAQQAWIAGTLLLACYAMAAFQLHPAGALSAMIGRNKPLSQ